MRIIAGTHSGRLIAGPRGREIRPMSDKAREAVFSILSAAVEDRPVLDLFAGTGAMGLEALSRGARSVLFIDSNGRAAALISANLRALELEDRAAVLVADVVRWWARRPELPADPALAFLTPPYQDFDRSPDRLLALVAGLQTALAAGSILVVESRKDFDPRRLPDPDRWDIRRYGLAQIALYDK